MSQRIRGVPDGEANTSVHVVYDAAEAMLGRVANLLRILAHRPGIAKWFIPLVAAVRQPQAGAVPAARLRNLAVLKTSTLNGCHY
ncbi:MAG: hypothetical protein ACREJV_10530 [Candidatus Rokuibacteriota bacterium]